MHRGDNRLCLVESLGVACVSITLLLVVDSPKMIVAVVPPWSLLLSIDRLSILFPVRLDEEHRGDNNLCLVEPLGVTCASRTLLLVVDSPKMWLQYLLGHSCRPSIASQYYSLSA